MNRKRVRYVSVVVVLLVLGASSALLLEGGASDPTATEPRPDAVAEGDGVDADVASAPGDPGVTSYPPDPKYAADVMIRSRGMTERFYREWMEYRLSDDAAVIDHEERGPGSAARAHSRDVAERGDVDSAGADGAGSTFARDGGLGGSCALVDRLVHAHDVTLVGADGGRLDVTSERVASAMFERMTDHTRTRETLLRSGYDTTGVGFYVSHHETETGAVVGEVYLTVDLCRDARSGG